jgi:hypothetical protein
MLPNTSKYEDENGGFKTKEEEQFVFVERKKRNILFLKPEYC